jgi:hypothetical protein
MAFTAGVLGLGWLELMSNQQRVFIFGADGLQDGFGDGWYRLSSPEIWVSNKFWEHRMKDDRNWKDHRGNVREPFPMGPAQQGNDHRANADAWDRTTDEDEYIKTGITRLDNPSRPMIPGATLVDPKSPVTGGSPALSPFREGEEAVRGGTDVQQGVEEDRQSERSEGGPHDGDRSDHSEAATGVQAGAASTGSGTHRTLGDERWLRGLNPKKFSASSQHGSGDSPPERYKALCETEAVIADRRRRIAEAKQRFMDRQARVNGN